MLQAWSPMRSSARAFEFDHDLIRDQIGILCSTAGMPELAVPIAAERSFALHQAAAKELAEREAERLAATKRWQAHKAAEKSKQYAEPKWGTKVAKQRGIERVRKEIDDRKK